MMSDILSYALKDIFLIFLKRGSSCSSLKKTIWGSCHEVVPTNIMITFISKAFHCEMLFEIYFFILSVSQVQM